MELSDRQYFLVRHAIKQLVESGSIPNSQMLDEYDELLGIIPIPFHGNPRALMSDSERKKEAVRIDTLIQQCVDAACANKAKHSHLIISYKAYHTDEWGIPINNLNEIAFDGPMENVSVVLVGFYSTFQRAVRTPVKWIDLAVLANEALIIAGEDMDNESFIGFDYTGGQEIILRYKKEVPTQDS